MSGLRRGKKDEETSFLEALEKIVPKEAPPRDETVTKTRSALLQAHRRRRAEPLQPTTIRRLFTRRTIIAAGAVVVVVGLTVFLTFFFLGKEREARILVHHGEVSVYRDGAVTPVVSPGDLDLQEQDRIVTSEEGRASIHVQTVNRARMDGSTELLLDNLSEKSSAFVQGSGRVYHRVEPDYTRSVQHNDVKVEGSDCIFDTHSHNGLTKTRVIQGKVRVTVTGRQPQEVKKGEEALTGVVDGEQHFEVQKYDTSVLDEPWYRWNLQRDEFDKRT